MERGLGGEVNGEIYMKELTISSSSSFMLCCVRWPDMAVIKKQFINDQKREESAGPLHVGNFFVLITILFTLVSFSGCGYTLQGGKLPGDVKRIAVMLFSNRTGQSGAEVWMTSALIDELMRGSQAVIWNDAKTADALIYGEIHSIHFGAVSRTADDSVYERSVTIQVTFRMVSKSGETIFSLAGFSESDTYTVPEGNEADEQAKKEAVNKIFHRLAQRVVSRMIDDF